MIVFFSVSSLCQKMLFREMFFLIFLQPVNHWIFFCMAVLEHLGTFYSFLLAIKGRSSYTP